MIRNLWFYAYKGQAGTQALHLMARYTRQIHYFPAGESHGRWGHNMHRVYRGFDAQTVHIFSPFHHRLRPRMREMSQLIDGGVQPDRMARHSFSTKSRSQS